MPTLPEPEGTTTPPLSPAEALRARLRAVAQAEEAKREASPAPTAPAAPTTPAPSASAGATGPEGLWDAPKAAVEEPISPFLIPIDPAASEPLRPHERVSVEPVRAAALPKARVVSLPAEPAAPVPDDRPALEAHVESILTLLRTDEVDEALAMLDTPTQDDTRPVIRTRFQLARELASVAKSLPPRVTQVLATAISRDDLEGAKSELVAFRQTNAAAAKDADVVLRTRAKSIQRGVAGALYVEPPVYVPPTTFNARPYESPKSSGANFWWVGLVVVFGIIRIALRMNTHSSYDYNYNYTPSYSSSYDNYARTAELMEAMEKSRRAAEPLPTVPTASPFEEPAELDKTAGADQLVSEIERSLFVLRENGWLTTAQGDAMTDFWVTSPYYTSCTEARTAMKAWEKLKMSDDLSLAKRHVKAVRARLDLVCPASKKKAAAKKPAKAAEKVELELTDTPPSN